MGRHGHRSRECEDRCSSPWRVRERDLCRQRASAHAVGRLEYFADTGPGDFIYVPPFVPHQEINASRDEPLSCVIVRSGQEPVVVNLEIAPAEPPEEVYWVDDIHSPP